MKITTICDLSTYFTKLYYFELSKSTNMHQLTKYKISYLLENKHRTKPNIYSTRISPQKRSHRSTHYFCNSKSKGLMISNLNVVTKRAFRRPNECFSHIIYIVNTHPDTIFIRRSLFSKIDLISKSLHYVL
jgi:hypothetical protein